MTFADELRKVKKNLKPSSVDTYLRNVRRIRKVHGTLPIPKSDSSWLKEKKLITWIDKQPLNVRRHLCTAAVIALKVYGKEDKRWTERQKKAMKEFDDDRRKRQMTDKQKKLIPAKGFAALKKVTDIMRKEIKHILSNKPGDWTKKDMLRVQDLLILTLYYDHPLRLDYASLEIGKSDKNCIYKSKGKPRGWHVQLADFKTDKSMGKQVFKPNTSNQRLLNKFVPASERLTDHGFLLSNKNGEKMSRQVLSKRLTYLTKHRIGKGFSVQLLRILYAMQHRKVLETAKEVSDKLLHSQEQSLQYAKKDD